MIPPNLKVEDTSFLSSLFRKVNNYCYYKLDLFWSSLRKTGRTKAGGILYK